MNTIDITEHNLDLADLENILVHQKIKPSRINYWNRDIPIIDAWTSEFGYLSLDIKIHRYSFTLFTGDYDYEKFYPILESSNNLNKLNVIIKDVKI